MKKFYAVKKRIFFHLIMFLLMFLMIAGIGEVVCRVLGDFKVDYWTSRPHSKSEPTVNMPDPVLGWRPKPGRYLLPSYEKGTSDIVFTIWLNGGRATDTTRIKKDCSVVLLGGSFSQGWGINDEDTFAWKLQEQYPDLKFVNLAAGAYGTLQSLLLLKERLAEPGPPSIVLYGFMYDHEKRNVATIDWLLALTLFTRRGHVKVPYCLLDKNNNLIYYSPQGYPRWPFDRFSHLINLIKNEYMMFRYAERAKQQKPVTKKLIFEMASLCREKGIEFYVLLLSMDKTMKKDYLDYFKREKIAAMDCVDAREHLPEMQLPIDKHPNAAMNTVWAERISKAMGPELEKLRRKQ